MYLGSLADSFLVKSSRESAGKLFFFLHRREGAALKECTNVTRDAIYASLL